MINFIILILLLSIAPYPQQAAGVAFLLAAAIVFELIAEIRFISELIRTL